MIGSISKIRPCGHHHCYKYAHCVKNADFKSVAYCYNKDHLIENSYEWSYPLLNYEGEPKVHNWLFDRGSSISKWIATLPKYKSGSLIRSSIPEIGIGPVELILPEATSIHVLSYQNNYVYGKMKYKFSIKAPKAQNADNLLQQSDTNDSDTKLELYLPKVSSGRELFRSMAGNQVKTLYVYIPNVENLNRAFQFKDLKTIIYPIDKDENCAWENNTEIIGYEYVKFPKCNALFEAFSTATLDKGTSLSILNSLQTSTSTPEEGIYGKWYANIGIHIDHKYDPEINIALKKVSNAYITPIEEYGATLPETITTDKGWSLTVQWNGTATENAYPEPEL